MTILEFDECHKPYAKNLSKEQIATLESISSIVKEKLEGDGSGHDWWHIYRVWQNACLIAQTEQCDHFLVQLAALLHDIDDWKFNGGDTKAGGRTASKILISLNVSPEIAKHVSEIIDSLSFKGAGVKDNMASIEGAIVQDADRLESMGAIGVARTFAYGGSKGRPIYDPRFAPEVHESFEQYKNSKGHSLNHFYEKLLLVKDRMNTKRGKELAQGRHKFIEQFLEQFFAEWSGKA